VKENADDLDVQEDTDESGLISDQEAVPFRQLTAFSSELQDLE